jgi:voltage-gated potassium channel
MSNEKGKKDSSSGLERGFERSVEALSGSPGFVVRFIEQLRNNDFVKALIFIVCAALVSATIMFFLERNENKSFDHWGNALWWAFVSLTTTGYGDITPITPQGKTVAVFILITGTILLSVLSGTVSSLLVTRNLREGKGLQEIKLKNHVIICGWNGNAEMILSTLADHINDIGGIVLVSEIPEELATSIIYQYARLKVKFVRGVSTDEDTLNRANIKSAHAVIIVPDDTARELANPDERALLTTLTVKGLSPKVKVYAHLVDKTNRQALLRARADGVILSGQHSSYLLATHVTASGVSDAIEDLMDYKTVSKFSQTPFPKDFIGKTFYDAFIHYRIEEKAILVGIVSEEKNLSVADILNDGSDSYLDEFIRRRFAESGKQLSKKSRNVQLNPEDTYVIQSSDSALLIRNK